MEISNEPHGIGEVTAIRTSNEIVHPCNIIAGKHPQLYYRNIAAHGVGNLSIVQLIAAECVALWTWPSITESLHAGAAGATAGAAEGALRSREFCMALRVRLSQTAPVAHRAEGGSRLESPSKWLCETLLIILLNGSRS